MQAAFGDSVDLVVDYLVVPTENWDIEVHIFNIRMSFAFSPALYHQIQFSLGQQDMALELEQEQKTQVEQQELELSQALEEQQEQVGQMLLGDPLFQAGPWFLEGP